MLIDTPSENDIHELELQLNLQQQKIEKQNREILNLKANLVAATKKSDELYSIIQAKNKLKNKKQIDLMLARRLNIMSKLVSAFAHEINQPLTAIIAYNHSCLHVAKNKLKYEKNDNKLVELLERMVEQTEHAGNIVHYMKGILQEGDFCVERTDVNSLLEESVSILQYELQNVLFKLTLNLKANLPQITTNKMSLMQIMLNLVRNRVGAIQDGSQACPELLIETLEVNGHIVIHFVGNEPQGTAKFKTTLLNTYSTKKSLEAGVSLNVCRALIESVGGALSPYVAKEKRSGFTLTLPITQ